jgi:hypothetical protein
MSTHNAQRTTHDAEWALWAFLRLAFLRFAFRPLFGLLR